MRSTRRLSEIAILCAHLRVQNGLTFYLISETPLIGLCGLCFARHGRNLEGMPRDSLSPVLPAVFWRRQRHSEPVYNRCPRRLEDYGF